MTEVELHDPVLRSKRHRLDMAKLIASTAAAVAATATLIVALLVLAAVSHQTATISDCTTPRGGCFQQLQQRNAESRARLVDASVAANYCAGRTSNLEAMRACVTRTLQEIGDR